MSELKVYLAAPYQMKELIRDRTLELQTLGINVTSSWVNEPEKPTIEVHEVAPQTNRLYAQRDVVDVRNANLLIFQDDPTKKIVRAGRHVEFGIAIAYRMPIFVVGEEHENIFHHLPRVKHFKEWPTVVCALQGFKLGFEG